MVLYIIGLGLGNEKDVTIRGFEAIKSSDLVYLESYTSIFPSTKKIQLESFYEKEILLADRDFVECQAKSIYLPAKDINVSFLVVGDPFCATTHADIILRARENDVVVEIIHNTSVMGAVGSCGLQLYNFGKTVSIPLFENNWKPRSFYDNILINREGCMHTLCLLDIKVKEPDFDAMIKGKSKYFPPKYMTINKALEQLIYIESIEKKCAYNSKETLCVGMARLAHKDSCIIAGTMDELIHEDFQGPLHCLVICGKLHEVELDFLQKFILKDSCYLHNEIE